MYPMNEAMFSQRHRNVDIARNALTRDQIYPTVQFLCAKNGHIMWWGRFCIGRNRDS